MATAGMPQHPPVSSPLAGIVEGHQGQHGVGEIVRTHFLADLLRDLADIYTGG